MREHGISASRFETAAAIRNACAEAEVPRFVDIEFPPGDEAFFKDPSHSGGAAVVWKRPSEFADDEVILFDRIMSPLHVRQGAVGNNWFLVALAVLAEYPV